MKNTKAQATGTKQTAAECYAERFAESQDLLKRIASRLEQHKEDQAQEPANWGYAELAKLTSQWPIAASSTSGTPSQEWFPSTP